jgi:hypothetical protein
MRHQERIIRKFVLAVLFERCSAQREFLSVLFLAALTRASISGDLPLILLRCGGCKGGAYSPRNHLAAPEFAIRSARSLRTMDAEGFER